MLDYKNLFKDDAVWGEQEVSRFRWLLITLILLFIAFIFINGEHERAWMSLALASFYIFYNSIINLLLRKYGSALWIRYLSATIDISVLSMHVFNYSYFFQPIAVVTAASTYLYPALILLSVLRYDGKLVFFSTVYSIICYNAIFYFRFPYIDPELAALVPSASWSGQIYKSAYFMAMGYFLFSIPKMIQRLAEKQSITLSQQKEIELTLALEKEKKELIVERLKKEKELNRQLEVQKLLIEEQKDSLQEAIATKDRLFSIIGHDLKSPFTAQISIVQLILDDFKSYSNEDIKGILVNILQSSHQGMDLLDNLLEWSRHQNNSTTVKAVPIRLKILVDKSINLLKQNINNKNISISNMVLPESIICADPNMVITIIRNLLSNAIKYSHLNGQIEISSYQLNNQEYLTISDNGIGMTDQQLSILFDNGKFKTTPGTQNELGSGLGLFLCKELADKNNAKIEVISEPTKGSTFSIVFPPLSALGSLNKTH